MPCASPRRIVAIGASNLTRGFQTIVGTARARWGRDVEIVAALGHGRSYGADSSVFWRTLPGVLQSGLWPQLESMLAAPTRALITDVGNDILYGYSPTQILDWVDEVLRRLEPFSDDVVITGLPSAVRDVSNAKFLMFRSLLFPRCRLTLQDVTAAAEHVDRGLRSVAAKRGARFVTLKPDWYGVDPIHIRPALWRQAWEEILCGAEEPAASRASWIEACRLYAMRPERQQVFGRECGRPQAGVTLKAGGRVWLY